VREVRRNFAGGNFARKAGYPSTSFQILYIDTWNGSGTSHAANYSLTFDCNVSVEFNYDYFYIVGGGTAQAQDPLGQSKSAILKAKNAQLTDPAHASDAGHDLLLQFTGSILSTGTYNTVPGGADPVNTQYVDGDQTLQPTDQYGQTVTIEAEHRALYVVMSSDCLFSTQDGNWALGNGCVIDNVSTSDKGLIYDEQASVNVAETTGFNGTVIRGTAALRSSRRASDPALVRTG
jgi:hypothetical protein